MKPAILRGTVARHTYISQEKLKDVKANFFVKKGRKEEKCPQKSLFRQDTWK